MPLDPAPLHAPVPPVQQLGLARAAVGVVLLVRPGLLPGLLGVDRAAVTATGWTHQMLGAREVAVGLGSVVALRSGSPDASRVWVLGGLLCDAVDVVAVTAAVVRRRVARGPGLALVAAAVAAVAVQAVELRRVPR